MDKRRSLGAMLGVVVLAVLVPAVVVAASTHAGATATGSRLGVTRQDVATRSAACEGGPSPTEVAHVASEGFEGVASLGETIGIGESPVGVVLGIAGKAAGYGFAWGAFNEATASFGDGSKDPVDKDFTALFTPVFAPVPTVKAPTADVQGAFHALNVLFEAQTRFAEIVVAYRVALDRAAAAATAGNALWQTRQADASARYALEASTLVAGFPRLDASVEQAFVADGLSLTVTPEQFAAAQHELARNGPPPILRHVLELAAAALRPASNPEVQVLQKLLLDTTAVVQAFEKAKPRALDLPEALDPRSLSTAETRAAADLQSYASDLLGPAPLRQVHAALMRSDCGSENPGGNGGSYGEPHEVTFSGNDYELQAAGEFTLVKSTDDNLEIQIREQPFPGAGDVAVNTATAMRVGPAIVELAANSAGNLELWIDRKPAPLADQVLPGGGTLTLKNGDFATVTWPDGTQATVYSSSTIAIAHQTATCNTANTIDLNVSVPHSRFGHLTGLLGDPSAGPFSDLVGGNGKRYALDQLDFPAENVRDYDLLYKQFAQSWRISQAQSLFVYAKGTGTSSFTNLAFPSRALTVQSLTPKTASGAKRTCAAAGITNPDLLSDCVFDVGVTGKTCFAGGDAFVQATTGGPPATSAPPSSGTTGAPAATTGGPASTKGQRPIAIGANPATSPSQAAVAVDPAGTATAAWLQPGDHTLDVCTLAPGATGCSPVGLHVPDPSTDQFFDPPTVLVAASRVYVFALLETTHDDDLSGIDEYVSTDGGRSFTMEPHAVGYVSGGDGTAGPIVPLPAGGFGAGYVLAGGNPGFEANSLASPADDSASTSPPYATLNPRPASSYTVGNLGGRFASQLTGSQGVLGVFDAAPGRGYSPCPASASAALVYAYAPLSAATTVTQVNSTTGAGGSPWRPLAEVDCDGQNPVVGGGPSGLGLLETDSAVVGESVQYRRFSPATGFGAPVTIAKGEQSTEGTLSQDAAGGIYATWIDPSTGVVLAYSSTRGASWSAPTVIAAGSGTIGALASAVDASGHGWAVYEAGGHEYAQGFTKADTVSTG